MTGPWKDRGRKMVTEPLEEVRERERGVVMGRRESFGLSGKRDGREKRREMEF